MSERHDVGREWALIAARTAEEIEEAIKAAGGPGPMRVEGLSDLTWVLLDYGDIVVHVFAEETRRFYDIERLYRDCPTIAWQDSDHSAAR